MTSEELRRLIEKTKHGHPESRGIAMMQLNQFMQNNASAIADLIDGAQEALRHKTTHMDGHGAHITETAVVKLQDALAKLKGVG